MPLSLLTTLALVTPCYCDLMGWKSDPIVPPSTEEKKALLAFSKGMDLMASAIAPSPVRHAAVTEVQFLTVGEGKVEGGVPDGLAAEGLTVEALAEGENALGSLIDQKTDEKTQIDETVVCSVNSQLFAVATDAKSAENTTIKNTIAATDATDEDETPHSLTNWDWAAHRELVLQPLQSLDPSFNLLDSPSPVGTPDEAASKDPGERTPDAMSADVLAQAAVEPVEEELPSDATVLGNPEDLVVGIDDLLPPPIPLGEARAELLEILGLDSQAPQDVAPVSRDVPPWAVTTYAGRFVSDDLGPALIGNLSGFEDSGLLGFGVARTIAGRRPISLEVDGQILQHFGNQGHTEGTVAIVARWHNFPWDEKIDTTFAVGEGLSFATSVPALEINRNGRSTQLLNYLLFELTFALPQEPDWQVVGRLHHRSGVFGLFDGVGSGSNIYVAGLRRRF
ncbi:MAG: hypothetical protein AAGC93_06265 [Cyanobacteria bacterium P01_F01_bin.53]